MDIPEHVQSALDVRSPISKDALTDAADAWSVTRSAFGLSGEEFSNAVEDALNGAWTINVSEPDLVDSTTWRYLRVSFDNMEQAWILSTPTPEDQTRAPVTEVGQPLRQSRAPATEIGQALVKSWLQHPIIVASNGQITSGFLITGNVPGARMADFASRLSSEWVTACFLLSKVKNLPCWVSKRDFRISANAKLLPSPTSNSNYENLLLQAISEFKGRWRFLSLYRILEHGYLDEIFKSLRASFFANPQESLTAASKSVANDLQQFLTLVEQAGLETLFGTFCDQFEKAKGLNNRFSHALDRSMREQIPQCQGKWKKGVLVCYKIRCAIVHAGLSAPIFEMYPDADELLDLVLPSLEEITLSFVGVTVI